MHIDPIVVTSIRASPEYTRNQKWCISIYIFIYLIGQNL